jgi:hypothetical protein
MSIFREAKAAIRRLGFPGSAEYWERRYRAGGTSGAGSYNRLAEFKASFLNDFVARNHISSVIEFGSGDGSQLELAAYPPYVGVDISKTVVAVARKRFSYEPSKTFYHSSELPPGIKADLSLSLDVIYHLIEDETFERYMYDLFGASSRYVIIYSSNDEAMTAVPHVRHRCFTSWVEERQPDFKLVEHVPNAFPFDESDQDNTSFADFYVFERS